MDDKTLLERAARAAGPLATVGNLALIEYAAWIRRNAARNSLRAFYKAYRELTGEWFDRGDAVDGGDEDGDVPEFDRLNADLKDAQRKLTSARSATRRAITRAAAAIGSAHEAQ